MGDDLYQLQTQRIQFVLVFPSFSLPPTIPLTYHTVLVASSTQIYMLVCTLWVYLQSISPFILNSRKLWPFAIVMNMLLHVSIQYSMILSQVQMLVAYYVILLNSYTSMQNEFLYSQCMLGQSMLVRVHTTEYWRCCWKYVHICMFIANVILRSIYLDCMTAYLRQSLHKFLFNQQNKVVCSL